MIELEVALDSKTLTMLLNACANGQKPDGPRAIECAEELRRAWIRRGAPFNHIHYLTLIKLYARLGTFNEAKRAYKQMIQDGYKADADAFSNLLCACIHDKSNGFANAIKIFNAMTRHGLQPNIYCFNLLLRCVRNCEVTETIVAENQSVDFNLSKSSQNPIGKSQVESRPPEQNKSEKRITDDKRVSDLSNDQQNNTENFLSPVEIFRNIGGLLPFVRVMTAKNSRPDITTFILLTDLVEDNVESELELLNIMKRFDIKPTVALFNRLIRKRSLRGDFDSSLDILQEMARNGLSADVLTFGCLAIGCRTLYQGVSLINAMLDAGIQPNLIILTTMLTRALCHMNFALADYVLKIMVKNRIKVDRRFIADVDGCLRWCCQFFDKKNQLHLTKGFYDTYRDFRNTYWKMLENMKLESNADTWREFQKRLARLDLDTLWEEAAEKPWAAGGDSFSVQNSKGQKNTAKSSVVVKYP